MLGVLSRPLIIAASGVGGWALKDHFNSVENVTKFLLGEQPSSPPGGSEETMTASSMLKTMELMLQRQAQQQERVTIVHAGTQQGSSGTKTLIIVGVTATGGYIVCRYFGINIVDLFAVSTRRFQATIDGVKKSVTSLSSGLTNLRDETWSWFQSLSSSVNRVESRVEDVSRQAADIRAQGNRIESSTSRTEGAVYRASRGVELLVRFVSRIPVPGDKDGLLDEIKSYQSILPPPGADGSLLGPDGKPRSSDAERIAPRIEGLADGH